jgi:hypothetical protein
MEKTRLKGLGLERRSSMKGLKEKKKGPSAYKKDRKHQAHIKSMQRRSRTQGA